MSELSTAVNLVSQHIEQFHDKIEYPAPDTPTFYSVGEEERQRGQELEHFSKKMQQSDSPLVVRAGYMLEEIAELLQSDSDEAQVDALCDLIFFAFGTCARMGVKPGNAFEAVHRANMRKDISKNGAKVTKPIGWRGPEFEIKADIERQKRAARGRFSACPGE